MGGGILYFKKCFFQMPFSQIKYYNIEYDDDNDLKNGLLDLIASLNKCKFLIEVFSHDPINDILRKYSNNKEISSGNFIYYVLESGEFLNEVNLMAQRFLCVYLLEKEEVLFEKNINKIKRSSAFVVSLDNYLEVAEARVDLSKFKNISGLTL